MARSDLLEYLQRYRETPRRRMRRVERWRRRGRRRGLIVATAEALAADVHAAGIGHGDRVGLWLKDGPLWPSGLFGVLRAGGVAVPFDTALTADAVVRMAAGLDLRGWVTDEELPVIAVDLPTFELRWREAPDNAVASPDQRGAGERVGRAVAHGAAPASARVPWPADDPSRSAQVVLTSGTTGKPQGVELTHANLRAVLDALEEEIARYRWLMRAAPRLRIAVALPLSHLYGQYMGVLLPVLLDADVAMLDNHLAAADLAGAIREERAWALASVPYTLSALVQHLLDEGRATWGDAGLERRLDAAASAPWTRRVRLFDRLRRRLGRRLVAVVSGGASLDDEVERLWRLLGYVVVQGYGLTEAAPLVTLNHPLRPRRGSVGTPLPGIEVRLSGDGEILVRGGNVAASSTGGPRIDADGWLYTGDLGEILDDGNIRFRGRRSERIVTSSGVNVDAEEVGAALRADPAIRDAFVLEQPWGASGTVCAVLTLRPGADAATAVRAANRTLADAAKVRSWFLWPHGDLPRTSTGKVRRAEVVAWLAGQAPEAAEAATAAPRASAHAPRSTAVERILDALSAGDGRGSGARQATPLDANIADLLSSLERVELASRIEELHGVAVEELFTGDTTFADLAGILRARSAAVRSQAAGDEHRDSEPGGMASAPHGARATAAAETPAFAAGAAAPGVESQVASSASSTAEGNASRRSTLADRTAEGGAPAPPNAATWRYRAAIRAARFALREAVMHPLARLIARFELESPVPIDELRAPFLLVANHACFIDPVIMFALPHRVRARLAPAARWSFFTEHPEGGRLYAWGVLGLNLFPLVQLGDWRPTLRIAGELADRGYSILIYPEGEISRDGKLHGFKQGAALISRELHLPIVPCATAGLERVLPPGSRRLESRPWRRPTVALCLGEPLPAARPGEDLARRTAQLERRVRQLRERATAIALAPSGHTSGT